MMESAKHSTTHASPAGRPQPIAFHDGALWVGSWETSRLYAIDPVSWSTLEEIALPGLPYGLASLGGMLHVVVSIGENDDRYVYRVAPGRPLDENDRLACPEFHGSHLTTDGTSLFLVQQTRRQILELGETGSVVRTIALPTRCAGAAFDGGTFYMISADDEFDVLELATFDLKTGGDLVKLAPMNVEARGLTRDGETWWTSLREQHEILSFSI